MTGPERDTPQRPDVTKAQKVAAVIAGVPVISNLLAAFGIFSPSPAQQHALTETMTWAAVAAGLLVASDAHLRGKRNDAVAAVQVAEVNAGTPTEPQTVANGHFDPGAVPLRDLVAGGPVRKGDEVRAVRYDDTTPTSDFDPPEPAPPIERDEIDLDDPLIDDPNADTAAGVSRSALAGHYSPSVEEADIRERDLRLGASA